MLSPPNEPSTTTKQTKLSGPVPIIPQPLTEFDARDGYAGFRVSAGYLKIIFFRGFFGSRSVQRLPDGQTRVVYQGGRQEWLALRMQQIDGRFLKNDLSFKLAKKILVDGERVFDCTETIMNEFNQVQTRLNHARLLHLTDTLIRLCVLCVNHVWCLRSWGSGWCMVDRSMSGGLSTSGYECATR